MTNQQRNSQELHRQLHALATEIQNLRSELTTAVDSHDSMRAQVVASHFRVESLRRRLGGAEMRQRRLLQQLGTGLLPPIGTGRGQHDYSSGQGSRGGTSGPPLPLPVGGYAPSPSHASVVSRPFTNACFAPSPSHGFALAQPLSVGRGAPSPSHGFALSNTSHISSSSTIRPRDTPAPTPRTRPSHLQPPGNDPRHNLAPLRVVPRTPSSAQPQRAAGITGNAAFLPMVIETILAESKRYEREGRLGTCGFVLDQANDKQCSRPYFNMVCFRAKHFYFCREHMRVVLAGNTVCSHRRSQPCLVVTYEHRIDWELIVEAAIAAGNLGSKGLEFQDLREALYPPELYPHQWMN